LVYDNILQTMMTLASIMDSQKLNTKLRFHFAVLFDLSSDKMLKIYSLRENIRDDVKFIFYNAQKAEKDLKEMYPKDDLVVAIFFLPHIIKDDIERLLFFDTRELLVLRDLKEMYNWNMSNYLYMGSPSPCIDNMTKITMNKLNSYINIGNILLNVKKIKLENIYENFLKKKNVYNINKNTGLYLLNDIAKCCNRITNIPISSEINNPINEPIIEPNKNINNATNNNQSIKETAQKSMGINKEEEKNQEISEIKQITEIKDDEGEKEKEIENKKKKKKKRI